jgi:hypothetical protein
MIDETSLEVFRRPDGKILGKSAKTKFPQLYRELIEYTSWLPSEAKLAERLFCVENNLICIPACKVCGGPLSYRYRVDLQMASYGQTCSSRCSALDPERRVRATASVSQPEVQERSTRAREATMMLRHGVKHAMQSEAVRVKSRQSNLDRLGVEYPTQSAQVMAKIKAKVQGRYGVEHVSQNMEVRAKVEQTNLDRRGVRNPGMDLEVRATMATTCLERYGVEFASQSEVFKAKSIATNLAKRGVRYCLQDPSIRERIKKTNLEKYGVETAVMSEQARAAKLLTCRNRYGVDFSSQATLGSDTLAKLQDPLWLENQYQELQSFWHIGKKLNCSATTIAKYFYGHKLKPNDRWGSSRGEVEIRDFVTSLGIEVVPNTRKVIAPLELDIYIPSKNLAIEYCGLYWHSSEYRKKNYHQRKLNECNQQGIRLVTIFEDEWLEKPEIVKVKLKSILQMGDQLQVGARTTSLRVISSQEKFKFLEANHIQGDGPGSICYGLENQERLVAVMTFIERSPEIFELTRYATSCNVPGGFTKLLKHFQQLHLWRQIFTFADLRWSIGDLYLRSGFSMPKVKILPDYSYVRGFKRLHKTSFRHTTGLPRLPNYDPTKSEFQLTREAGIFRIYNCGLQRWVLNNIS